MKKHFKMLCTGIIIMTLASQLIQTTHGEIQINPNEKTSTFEDYYSASVDSSGDNTCYVLNDNTAQCIGTYSHTFNGQERFADAPAKRIIRKVYAGQAHACVLDTIGNTTCKGFNNIDGALVNRDGRDVASMSLGFLTTCLLLNNNKVICQGLNVNRKIIDYTKKLSPMPMIQIASGFSHLCALDSTQNMYCTGNYGTNNLQSRNSFGLKNYILSQNNSTYFMEKGTTIYYQGSNSINPKKIYSGDIARFSAGGNGVYILLSNGSVIFVDINGKSSSFNSSTDNLWVSAGDNHACVLKINGDLFCKGGNFGKGKIIATNVRRTNYDNLIKSKLTNLINEQIALFDPIIKSNSFDTLINNLNAEINKTNNKTYSMYSDDIGKANKSSTKGLTETIMKQSDWDKNKKIIDSFIDYTVSLSNGTYTGNKVDKENLEAGLKLYNNKWSNYYISHPIAWKVNNSILQNEKNYINDQKNKYLTFLYDQRGKFYLLKENPKQSSTLFETTVSGQLVDRNNFINNFNQDYNSKINKEFTKHDLKDLVEFRNFIDTYNVAILKNEILSFETPYKNEINELKRNIGSGNAYTFEEYILSLPEQERKSMSNGPFPLGSYKSGFVRAGRDICKGGDYHRQNFAKFCHNINAYRQIWTKEREYYLKDFAGKAYGEEQEKCKDWQRFYRYHPLFYMSYYSLWENKLKKLEELSKKYNELLSKQSSEFENKISKKDWGGDVKYDKVIAYDFIDIKTYLIGKKKERDDYLVSLNNEPKNYPENIDTNYSYETSYGKEVNKFIDIMKSYSSEEQQRITQQKIDAKNEAMATIANSDLKKYAGIDLLAYSKLTNQQKNDVLAKIGNVNSEFIAQEKTTITQIVGVNNSTVVSNQQITSNTSAVITLTKTNSTLINNSNSSAFVIVSSTGATITGIYLASYVPPYYIESNLYYEGAKQYTELEKEILLKNYEEEAISNGAEFKNIKYITTNSSSEENTFTGETLFLGTKNKSNISPATYLFDTGKFMTKGYLYAVEGTVVVFEGLVYGIMFLTPNWESNVSANKKIIEGAEVFRGIIRQSDNEFLTLKSISKEQENKINNGLLLISIGSAFKNSTILNRLPWAKKLNETEREVGILLKDNSKSLINKYNQFGNVIDTLGTNKDNIIVNLSKNESKFIDIANGISPKFKKRVESIIKNKTENTALYFKNRLRFFQINNMLERTGLEISDIDNFLNVSSAALDNNQKLDMLFDFFNKTVNSSKISSNGITSFVRSIKENSQGIIRVANDLYKHNLNSTSFRQMIYNYEKGIIETTDNVLEAAFLITEQKQQIYKIFGNTSNKWAFLSEIINKNSSEIKAVISDLQNINSQTKIFSALESNKPLSEIGRNLLITDRVINTNDHKITFYKQGVNGILDEFFSYIDVRGAKNYSDRLATGRINLPVNIEGIELATVIQH